MQYVPLEKGIEVNGEMVRAVIDGFQSFTLLASQFLLAEGIGTRGADGVAQISPNRWYSQEGWLRAFQSIGEKIGEAALMQIGLALPRNARFPPWVTDIRSALRDIDLGYHLAHRKNGREMANVVTGERQEGIGHYGYEPVANEKKVVSVCDNPYPCAFDQGLITAVARKFHPTAQIAHDTTQPCRKKGAESCTYVITWT